MHKLGREVSPETTLNSAFQLPDCDKINICCPSCSAFGILCWQLKLRCSRNVVESISVAPAGMNPI